MTWLTISVAPTLCLAAPTAVPQPPKSNATSFPPLRVIRRLPPVTDLQPYTCSLEGIGEVDQEQLFDIPADSSLDKVFDVPAIIPGKQSAPGKPTVNGWIQVGYGSNWIVQ